MRSPTRIVRRFTRTCFACIASVTALAGCASLDGLDGASADDPPATTPAERPRPGADAGDGPVDTTTAPDATTAPPAPPATGATGSKGPCLPADPFTSTSVIASDANDLYGARYDATRSNVFLTRRSGNAAPVLEGGPTPATAATLPLSMQLGVEYPAPTPDGLTLYYQGTIQQNSGQVRSTGIYRATRGTVNDPFSGATAVFGTLAVDEEEPYVASSQALYWTHASYPNRDAPEIRRLAGGQETTILAGATNPVVSRDEKTLYFAYGSPKHIYYVERDGPNAVVPSGSGSPLPVAAGVAMNGALAQAPTWISDDACTLLYEAATTTAVNGPRVVMKATRAPH